MDALGLATAEDKLKAITQLAFPAPFTDIDTYIGMTGYLRKYAAFFAQIAKPFSDRKTLMAEGITAKANAHRKQIARINIDTPAERELDAFEV